MQVIEVTDLTKRFNSNGISFAAVDQITFTVEEGGIFALLGPNGAGKTTLIKILTTLLKPTSGMAKVAGFDVTKEKEKVRASIGIVFQEPALDRRLTGRENLDFHARMYGIKRGERERRVAESLKLVELEEKADIVVDKYSGGMNRRLELARGFIHHPKVLFLDEPTLGLDTQTRRRTWDYIKELNEREGVTIVLTTHYMEEAEYLCDRVGIIDRGKIIVLDSPRKLMDLIGSDLVTLELNTPNAAAIFETLDFVTDVQAHNGFVTLKMERADLRIPTLMEHARESGLEIKSVNMRKPSLEDVFLHFTGRRIRE
uniref:Glucose import ATP-binding protein GlcV n=1 Tax=Candidatus Methanophaga sp. ANME-1 ERB7 TaxID=2759913 RepID=A0A7G9Z5J0_9EURY|nr:glucose import ATP-binding protein GlcV [Methanosarcinales archaeon ANME-1 ERB7]